MEQVSQRTGDPGLIPSLSSAKIRRFFRLKLRVKSMDMISSFVRIHFRPLVMHADHTQAQAFPFVRRQANRSLEQSLILQSTGCMFPSQPPTMSCTLSCHQVIETYGRDVYDRSNADYDMDINVVESQVEVRSRAWLKMSE